MASVVSESDIAIFQALSNPAVTCPVNGPVRSRVSRTPSPSRFSDEEGSESNSRQLLVREQSDTHDTLEFNELEDQYRPAAPTPPSPAHSNDSETSLFNQAVDASGRAFNSNRVDSTASSQHSTPRGGSARLGGGTTRSSIEAERGGNIFGNFSQRAVGVSNPGGGGGGVLSVNSDDLISKQQALLEIERLKTQGVTVTRNYTIHDRLEDIEFEVRRHQLHMEEQVTLTMMKDMLKIAFGGIEMANNRLGPWLDLDGWSTSMTADLAKYDSALSRIYRKHARKSSMSAESELALGILSSIGVHHCRKKFSKNLASEMGFDSRRSMPKPTAPRPFGSNMSVQEEDDDEGLPPV
mgnify:CR=1 FL=1|tara:strand:+ start:1387 stop:2442 length:1056 start_codon:yes stop_codon:yes gene_type:complete